MEITQVLLIISLTLICIDLDQHTSDYQFVSVLVNIMSIGVWISEVFGFGFELVKFLDVLDWGFGFVRFLGFDYWGLDLGLYSPVYTGILIQTGCVYTEAKWIQIQTQTTSPM